MAERALVDIHDVSRRYGARVALDSLSLVLHPGEICGLVGPNGGGKTTSLRITAGILRPHSGHGHVLGFDLIRGAGEIRKHAGYMSQRLSLYADLSVLQNLRFRAEVYGVAAPRHAAARAVEEYGLAPFASTPAGRLSGGWARRLQLAASLLHAPRLVLLDEPTAGLDASSRHEVWRRIADLAAAGAGVLVCTHDLAEAERCSSAVFLSEGRVLARGTPEAITRASGATVCRVTPANRRLDAIRLDSALEAVPGVVATYPHGGGLRVVARPETASTLERIAGEHGADFAVVGPTLEDAALSLAPGRRGAA